MNTRVQPATTQSIVTFEPGGQQIPALPGETLLDCARRAGIRVASVCGGRGLCKTCVVRITCGPVDAASEADANYFSSEELAENWRRACQAVAVGDCTVEIPARAQAIASRTQVESEDIWVRPDPVVRSYRVKVTSPTLANPSADDERLKQALNEKWPGVGHRLDLYVQQLLPAALRKWQGEVDVVSRFGEVIGILPPGKAPLFGLAVDIGTTNIGVLLVDLRTGRTLTSRGIENPQSIHGGDVITRLGHARASAANLREMQELVVGAINDVARSLCAEQGATTEHIADVVIAGNTAMHHFFLNLPVTYLAVAPFAPAVSGAVDVRARLVGLETMAGAYVHALPNIAGYVGGDHTAVLLAISSREERKTVVVLDVGTNTEISLLHHGALWSLSCPSGPALEGGHIRHGMRSAPGAIETVRIEDGEVLLKTIDDQPPVGICGSGVLDICAQLHLCGATSATGRMDANHPRVRYAERRKELEFVLAAAGESGTGKDITFTQGDVRSVQLATGAIRAGVEMLLEESGLKAEHLDQVIIAGAFGSYIDVASAVTIGMLPVLPLDRFAQIGNAASIGAKLALISHAQRAEAVSAARGSHYLELSGSARFNTAFMHSMSYPKQSSKPQEGS
ncbi:MAG: DUF4445 domain-containing protein [Gammaproteobacteria bacterium]|nr:DUF4445 domain-containing protein [Gammaproteobacteria bacterium]